MKTAGLLFQLPGQFLLLTAPPLSLFFQMLSMLLLPFRELPVLLSHRLSQLLLAAKLLLRILFHFLVQICRGFSNGRQARFNGFVSFSLPVGYVLLLQREGIDWFLLVLRSFRWCQS